jgi:hypothetical protein
VPKPAVVSPPVSIPVVNLGMDPTA